MDLLGAPVFTKDFVVAGTCSPNLHGMCESMYRPDMVSIAHYCIVLCADMMCCGVAWCVVFYLVVLISSIRMRCVEFHRIGLHYTVLCCTPLCVMYEQHHFTIFTMYFKTSAALRHHIMLSQK